MVERGIFARGAALALDPTVKHQLESLARAGATPQKLARKCQVILLGSEGVPNQSISQQTGLSRPTVIATRAAFRSTGIEGLCQFRKRRRLRPVLTPELEQKILDSTLKTRPSDATHWSVRALARTLGISRMIAGAPDP